MRGQPENPQRAHGRGEAALLDALDALAEDLSALADAARELPGDAGAALADEDDFQRARAELELELLGTRALLARRDLGDEAAAAAAIRIDEATDALAGLVSSSFGYYALPDPDPLLIDNEGPIGHHRALELMRRYGDRFVPPPSGGAGGRRHDRKRLLARQLLGPDAAP